MSATKYFHEAGGGHYDARFFRGCLEPELIVNILMDLLANFTRLCRTAGVTPILMHGGLIGWFWSRNLLPWDDDLDLGLLGSDLTSLQECASDTDGFLFDVNPNHRCRVSLNRHHHENFEPNRIDARFIHTPTGLFIDISLIVRSAPGLWSTKCPHHYREEDLFPLRETEVGGIPIHVPHRPDRVLEQEYGPNAIREPYYGPWVFNALTRSWNFGWR